MLIVAPTSFNWDEDELVVVTAVDNNAICKNNAGNATGPCILLTVDV
jgi:hypothetical protein